MRLGTIAFLVGIVVFQQLSALPDVRWLGLLVLLVPLAFFFPHWRFLYWFAAGFLLVWLHAGLIFAHSLAPQLEGRDIVVEGVIASIPQQRERSIRFEYDIDAVLTPGVALHRLPQRIRLNRYHRGEDVDVGQRWRLTVRLKQPHGFMNPGGFDYEAWLFRHGIRATGYVRNSEDNRFLGLPSSGYVVDQWRSALSKKIDEALPGSANVGMIKALAIGQRDDISDEQWQVLVRTGTNHLMAISGLHVGLIAGLSFLVVRFLWGLFPGMALRWPSQKAAALAAILAALGYAAMAGFSIPTQRALIMVAVFMVSLLMERFRRPLDGLLLALLLVLVFDPLAVMDAGFWLSFAAVGFILLVMAGRLNKRGGVWWRWGRVHMVMGIVLVPITLLFFHKASLISPVANLIAVPWMSLLVVPLVLLGTVMLSLSPVVGTLFLQLADTLIGGLWPLLAWCSELSVAQVSYALASPWLVIPALLGCVWLMLPAGWPGRWLGLVWLATAVLIPIPRPQQGEVWFTLLDVGQGLAAVAQTRDHVLVFDTGPRFSETFDTGEAVVLPFLRQAGRQRIDTLIVSHGDNDHIGGVHSVMAVLPVERLLASDHDKLQMYAPHMCTAGDGWHWNGVAFEVLHPADSRLTSENNNSCVLKISTQAGSVLLTGDIERLAEKSLLAKQGTSLDADVLVVPHHGSKTSSTEPFVDAVSPAWALIPVGYKNRFKLPRQEVVERYQKKGARVVQSGHVGAIDFRFTQQGLSGPEYFRFTGQRYWTHLP